MFHSAYIRLFLMFLLLPPAALVMAHQEPTGVGEKAAQEKPAAREDSDALRKAAQNPVSGLISVPLQNNTDFRIGPNDCAQDVLTFQRVIKADWRARKNKWVVPFRNGVGRIMRLGFQPVNITAQFCGNTVHPEGASSSSMRPQNAFLFPTPPMRQRGDHPGWFPNREKAPVTGEDWISKKGFHPHPMFSGWNRIVTARPATREQSSGAAAQRTVRFGSSAIGLCHNPFP